MNSLQPERTALAWNRTALLITVNGALAIKMSWSTGQAAYALVGAVLLVAAAGASVYGAWRRRGPLAATTPVAPHPLAISVIAGISFIACLAAIPSALVD